MQRRARQPLRARRTGPDADSIRRAALQNALCRIAGSRPQSAESFSIFRASLTRVSSRLRADPFTLRALFSILLSTTIVLSMESWSGLACESRSGPEPEEPARTGPELQSTPFNFWQSMAGRPQGFSNDQDAGRGANTSPMMWIVRLALRRPYTFVVFALLILILGVLSIETMPADIFPNIDIPVVTVVWQFPASRRIRSPTAS